MLRKFEKLIYSNHMNTNKLDDESTPIADNGPGERTISGQPTEQGWHWIKDAKGAWQAVWIEKFPSGSLWVCIPSSGKTDDQWWRPVARLKGEWGPRIQTPDQPAPAPNEPVGLPVWNGIGEPGSIMSIPEGSTILPPPGPQDIVARAVQTGKTMTLKEWSESMLEKAPLPTPRTDEFVAYMNYQFPATVGHIPMREKVESLELELAEARALLNRALPYLEEHTDDGAAGSGWKSPELEALIAAVKEST